MVLQPNTCHRGHIFREYSRLLGYSIRPQNLHLTRRYMPWQPPIPAGALYSKAARDLGPALPLLAYCYDLVQRDGWFTINLHDVAGDMEESYPTIKRWWQNVAAGPFFAEIQARGRKGIRARFKDIWIDWRILSTRKRDEIGPETGSEMIPNDETGDIRAENGTTTGSEMIPLPPMYKVLHDDQESGSLSPTPSQPLRVNPNPNQAMVMMLMEKGIKSPSVANEIAAMGLDYPTVVESIDNLLADATSVPAIIGFLRANPPIPGQPYPRARAPAEGAAGSAGGGYTKQGSSNGKHLRQSAVGNYERGNITETDLDRGF